MKQKSKICFILSDVYKALAFEWIVDRLDKTKFDISFILLLNQQNSELERFLQKTGTPYKRIPYTKKTLPLCFVRVSIYLLRNRIDIIHTHLRYADIIGQLAGFVCGIKKRIYTRHSSTYNHLYHPSAVRIDKWVNRLATAIIAISEVTRDTMTQLENVPPAKITLIHHGFDLEGFQSVCAERVARLAQRYHLEAKPFIIGSIARYTEWKGYQYSIPAFGAIYAKYPQTHFLLANANGDYTDEIRKLLHAHLPAHAYTEIPFENDIQALYQLLSIYVHVPVDKSVEAFGQTYVESLASGIPAVVTLSGIAHEFIEDGYNALVVPYRNSEAIATAVDRLMSDDNLRRQLIENGRKSIAPFALPSFIQKLTQLYLN